MTGIEEKLIKKINVLGNKLSIFQWRDLWGILREAERDKKNYWNSVEKGKFFKIRNVIHESGIMGTEMREEDFRGVSVQLANTLSLEDWKTVILALNWYNDNPETDFKKTSERLRKFISIFDY